MSNGMCNGVTNGACGCVQNQSQNQTVVTSVFGSPVAKSQDQVQYVPAELSRYAAIHPAWFWTWR